MPEERGLYPKMRVIEQVAYFARLRGIPRHRADQAAAALIEQMDITAGPRDYVQALSLGNQQRVQLAAALVHDPELLILDEPFSGLDPVGVDTMADVLARRRAQGTGVLFSSHQLELVERLCDRVVIVRNGSIVADGTLDELRGAEAHRELEVSVSGSPCWPPGVRVVSQDGDHWVLAVDEDGVRSGVDSGVDQAVLAAAVAAGRVEHFGWRTPSLVELYREVIAA
jgi:ABC-2 type transport system ATP-binding protein